MTEEVLVLDDDAVMLNILAGVLSGAGYTCLVASSANEALSLIEQRPQIAVVVSDVFMPEVSGLQFVNRLNATSLRHPPPRVLLLTGQPSLETAVDALRLGVRDFLVKPVRPTELIEAVKRVMAQAIEDRNAQRARPPQVEMLMRQAEELVGRLRTLAYSGTTESGAQAGGAENDRDGGQVDERPATEIPMDRSHGDAEGAGKLTILDTIEQLRRLRERFAGHKLDDVAWDLLLELLRAERLRQRLSVSGLAISITGVSATTSLRRMNELATRGYIERIPDPADARRDFVALTQKSQALLAEYLAQANAYVSAVSS
jgi:CheY-like chemotaxis protein/DNA-binding MarR family transcriptional regulator